MSLLSYIAQLYFTTPAIYTDEYKTDHCDRNTALSYWVFTTLQHYNKKPSYRWGTARRGRASWNLV